eukprot:TRINITY_DN22951_c0_g1_i1.p1 TRINITY_DN22951_c0_g1~~TRINITY_DN22951_c0_g1_i1.p1  ORF type:complete len:1019 (-),score=235.91 TRINITY_DN22951_c0_g1_i1:119-2923(-)
MSAKPREYAFDRSYWSCDSFTKDPDGKSIPDGPDSKYVSQDMLFDDVGKMSLNAAMNGYNVTLFAYGQSGCGKSYSVVGFEPEIGLIPRTLTHVFAVADGNTDPNIRWTVEIAMLEIYMDEIYDLLVPREKNRKPLGIYITKGEVVVYDPNDRKNMDKIWRAAKNYEQAEAFRQLGDKNRSIRSTGMNPTSSRGHTIFQCRVRKETKHDSAWVEDLSTKMSLVDLAGSERAHDTGLTGIGLEEGIAINQSLSCLGLCLKQVCDGKRVCYQDKLTKLLSESLGGTAVTVMIAALSPADINYEDTLSTLRFADNAKKMPVKAQKKLDPTAELIRTLQEENERLKAQLSEGGRDGEGGGKSQEEQEQERKQWEEKLAAANARIEATKKALSDMEQASQAREREHLAKLEELTKSKEELEAEIAEMETEEALQQTQMRDTETEIANLETIIAQLKEQGQDTSQQLEEYKQLRARKAEEVEKKQELEQRERKSMEQLCESKLQRLESLMQERNLLRASMALARQSMAAVADDKQAELQAKQEAVSAAFAECEQLVDKAYAHGCGSHFFFAVKSLARQEAESKVTDLKARIERLSKQEAARLEADKIEAEKAAKKAEEDEQKAYSARAQEVLAAFASASADRAEIEEDHAVELAGALSSHASLEQKLKDLQDMLQSIMAKQQVAWEEKLRESDADLKRLNDAFADGGVSVMEITELFLRTWEHPPEGKVLLPYLLNELDDEINQGLVYFIPDGETKVKRLDRKDTEPGIKLDHSCVKTHHATFISRVPANCVSIRADDPNAIIWLDGQAVHHGDAPKLISPGARIIFGNQFCFKFVDPRIHTDRSVRDRVVVNPKDEIAALYMQLRQLDKETLARALQIARQEPVAVLPGAVQDPAPTKQMMAVVPSGADAKDSEVKLRKRIQELELQLEQEKKKCCTVM